MLGTPKHHTKRLWNNARQTKENSQQLHWENIEQIEIWYELHVPYFRHKKKPYDKIHVPAFDHFATPCSLNWLWNPLQGTIIYLIALHHTGSCVILPENLTICFFLFKYRDPLAIIIIKHKTTYKVNIYLTEWIISYFQIFQTKICSTYLITDKMLA